MSALVGWRKVGSSDRLQPVLEDLVDELAVLRQPCAHLGDHPIVLAERPCSDRCGGRRVLGYHFGAEPHSIQHVLVARPWEYLFQAIEFVEEPGRLIFPQGQQLLQAIRQGGWIDIVAPKRRIGSLGEHVMELEEVDYPTPAIMCHLIEALR